MRSGGGSDPSGPGRAVTADILERDDAISVSGAIERRVQADLGSRIGGMLVATLLTVVFLPTLW